MNKTIEEKVFGIYINYVVFTHKKSFWYLSNRQVGRGKPLLSSPNVFHPFCRKITNSKNKKMYPYFFLFH